MGLNSIDGYAVDPIESLKAEWLYSQGRGRQFRVGEHSLLAQYLASVCPLSGECLENETDRKLRLILSKAQQHQQQLNQQNDAGIVHGMSPSPAARRRFGTNRNNSPRRPSLNRNSVRLRSPDRMAASCHTETMVSSCHGALSDNHDTLMTQSLDPNMLCNTFTNKPKESLLSDVEETSSPLQAATKLVPVPESLMSPDFRPPSGLGRILPKTPPSKLNSPVQTIVPSKLSNDPIKSVSIVNTANSMGKTTVSTLKTSSPLMRSNSASNCTGKGNIVKPITTNINGKCPQAVKINNYVQSKTMTPKRSAKNSPNLPRLAQRSKIPTDMKSSRLNGQRRGKDMEDHIGVSSDEDSEVCQSKLDAIRHRANQRRQEDTNKCEDETEKAAICIQRMWRGYHTRNLNKKVINILKTIETMRTNKYIQKLSTDMEATRTALESEHKLQLLQMQAINALWKKVVSLQPRERDEVDISTHPNIDVVTNLAQTCHMLHTQVQQLQDSMSEIKRCLSNMQPKVVLVDHGVGTQTEISAVHTPAGEENTFPYAKQIHRPQSLSIHQTIHEGSESKSFASNLVDSVLKKVSQSTDTTDDEINTDILNSNSNPEINASLNPDHPEIFKSCEESVESELRDTECDNENPIKGNVIVCEETLCKELHNLIKIECSRQTKIEGEENDSNEMEIKQLELE